MTIVINSSKADANSRLTGIRLAVLTSRFMELWRREKYDSDTVVILMAVIAITSEKLTRTDLTTDHRSLENYLPLEMLTACNVSSIAAATGLNRETARRRVDALVRAGTLIRTDAGEIALPPASVQEPATLALLRKQLEAVTRFVNESLRDGVLEVQ
jgi:hypothetical protein